MNLSIKLLAIIALFFSFTFAANAQRGGGKSMDPEKMAEKETAQMVEKLSLDDSQTVKVKDISLTYAKKINEAREENKDNRDAMKIISASINSQKSTEMKLVLTEEQYEVYEEMQTERGKGKRKGGRGKRGGE